MHAAAERMNDRQMSVCDHSWNRWIFCIHNCIIDSCRMQKDIEWEELQQPRLKYRPPPFVSMVMHRDCRSDQRCYNARIANESTMVFVNEDGELLFECYIRVYPFNPDNSSQFININILNPDLIWWCMPYCIHLVNHDTQKLADWELLSNDSRVQFSMLQYKITQTAIQTSFNPIISARKLISIGSLIRICKWRPTISTLFVAVRSNFVQSCIKD